MLPYTTPYHIFRLPVNISLIEKLFITYSQEDTILFEKTLDDCTVIDSGNKVRVQLQQQDTSLVRDIHYRVEVQVTVLTKDGNRLTSEVVEIRTGKVLKEGVIE